MTPRDDNLDEMPADADADLVLLDAYLDGEVDPPGAAALAARLAADADLAAALAELRSQRAGRQLAFAAMEPSAVAVDRFAWRVRGAVVATSTRSAAAPPRRSRFRLDPWSAGRVASAAAACVTLGFFGGRLGRPSAGPESVAVAPASTPAPVVDRVDVPITDDYGRVVARQPFADADQAKRFSDEWRQAHEGGPIAGPTRLMSETRY